MSDPRDEHDDPPESLAGRLLVASPELTEDVFSRSVVLVLQHGAEGAEGVVLNKPIGASVDSVLPGWQEGASAPQQLFQGGPVALDSAVGLAGVRGHRDVELGLKRLFGSIAVVDLDAPQEVVWPEISGLRVFAGYSGWTKGQLEGELAHGAWYVVDAHAEDVFDPTPDTLWRRVLRRQAAPLAWLSTYPADPSLN